MTAKRKTSVLEDVAAGLGGAMAAVWAMSGVVNLLALTGSLYMLQVYDRVLSSHSVPTLVALSILAIGLYLYQGGLDVIRTRLLVRLAARVDRRLMVPAHDAAINLPLRGRSTTESLQPMRDVESIRAFIGGPSLLAILDLPWLPLYVGFVFLLHSWLGWLAIFGAVVLIALTVLTDTLTRERQKEVVAAGNRRLAILEGNAQNAEVLHAMGFGHRALLRFARANAGYLGPQEGASDRIGLISAISKGFRMLLQSATLGLGAYLTLRGEVTAGAIIAAAIATSRALAPIELSIANWRVFVAARQSAKRLQAVFATFPKAETPLALPAPVRNLTLEGVTVVVPSTQKPVLGNVSLEVKAGQGLALIGPSAAGKSSLVRVMVGVWPPARGAVRVDGHALDRWPSEALGPHVGYLPQDVELFDGTIAENISRFEENPESAAVIAAAKAANVHEMIQRLPKEYDAEIGERGVVLSAGQRQRIALARALYRDPFLVVLDEPNSNLDAEGEAALVEALMGVRARGGIVVVVAHRESILAAVDLVAVVNGGQVRYGPRDEVLRALKARPAQVAAGPGLAVVTEMRG